MVLDLHYTPFFRLRSIPSLHPVRVVGAETYVPLCEQARGRGGAIRVG